MSDTTDAAAKARMHPDSINNLLTVMPEEERTVISLVTDLIKISDGQGGTTTETAPKLIVERQRLPPPPPVQPVRAETKPRAHTFNHWPSFLLYAEKNGGDGTVVTINPADGCAEMVLNEKEKRGTETIVYVPEFSAQFRPWQEAIKVNSFELLPFGNFLRVNRRAIKAVIIDNGEAEYEQDLKPTLRTLSQLRITSETKIMEGTGKDATNGIIVRTTISSGKETAEKKVEIPDSIVCKMPIFADSTESDLTFDISYQVRDYKAYIKITNGDTPAQLAAKIAENLTTAQARIGKIGGIATYGKLDWSNWNYLAAKTS